jgi:hypothetical protein
MLRRILIVFGYIVLTLVVVGLTIVLVAYGNDYRYDWVTHKIIQNGHVIIDSLPNNVDVVADGHYLNKKTPYQAAYTIGNHTFSLNLSGYYPWTKTVSISAGEVSLLQYVILVPKRPDETVLDSRATVVAQSMSKDHHHLAYITGGPEAALYTLDLGNPHPVKLYTPKPAVSATATSPAVPAEVLTGVTWSDDASHLLVSATVGGQPEELLASSSGGTPINLSQQYGFSFTGIQFSASNWQQLYWIAPDGLRKLDVGAQTVSDIIASGAIQFWITPNRVLYAQQTPTGTELWSVDNNYHQQELIEALAHASSYSVAYASFLGQDELGVVPSSNQTGTLYSGIFGSTPIATTIAHGVDNVSFSPDGHLAEFDSPSSIVVYDLNQSELQDKLVDYTVTGQKGSLEAVAWFDNYHLLENRSGVLYWSEYDGGNSVKLDALAGAFPAYSSSDTKSIYEFKQLSQSVHIDQVVIRH